MFLFTALFTLAGSSAIAAIITGAMNGRRSDTERLITDLRTLQDELGHLRAGYRECEREAKAMDAALDAARDKFEAAAYRCINEEVIRRSKRYVEVGDRYAALDPDIGYSNEKAAYDALAGSIAARLRRLTPMPRKFTRSGG